MVKEFGTYRKNPLWLRPKKALDIRFTISKLQLWMRVL
jgi:hypothetical protein